MLKFLLLISLFCSMLCYLNIDPMKSCLFLILSLIFISPILSFGNQIWFSYFICLVFLSGIFVILVYFSSLSKYNFFKMSFFFFIFFILFFLPTMLITSSNNILFNLYFFDYLFLLLWIMFSFILFMNYTSYYLNFSGALRKI